MAMKSGDGIEEVAMTMKKWHAYLLGQKFKICTNLQALKYLVEQMVGTLLSRSGSLNSLVMSLHWNTRQDTRLKLQMLC